MCCFSGESRWWRYRSVEKVSATNIFVRAASDGNQMLVYSMQLRSKIDLAMILPLPVPAATSEHAVRFVSLKSYPQFFSDLRRGFPDLYEPTRAKPATPPFGIQTRPTLPVHEVGDLEASYVPSAQDWDRLDARFRIPPRLFDAVPAYRRFGFAVFKLKATGLRTWRSLLPSRAPTKTIHPMAFEFPRADPEHLFFPTVHVHDGRFHPTADFDHTLYCQGPNRRLSDWRQSDDVAEQFMDIRKAEGLIEPQEVCFKLDLQGKMKNEDVIV